jgi:hypothetical protein
MHQSRRTSFYVVPDRIELKKLMRNHHSVIGTAAAGQCLLATSTASVAKGIEGVGRAPSAAPGSGTQRPFQSAPT